MRKVADTEANKKKFLQYLRQTGTLYHACRKSRIPRCTVYRWVRNDPKFRERMLLARESAIERLENSVFMRAMKDTREGALLAMFVLKANRPEKYRDNYKADPDEHEVNQAIERELARLAPDSPPKIVGTVEGTIVRQSTSPSETEGIPPPTV